MTWRSVLGKLPDWLLYLAVVVLIISVARSVREEANAPPPPPSVPGEAAVPLDPRLPFDPAGVMDAPQDMARTTGTAFSISEAGVWLTARHVVENCRRVVIMVSDGQGVSAQVGRDVDSEIVTLTTQGGVAAIQTPAGVRFKPGAHGYLPGYPDGEVGEIAVRYLGPASIHLSRRRVRQQPVTAWTITGRTTGMVGPLHGLSGAPIINPAGQAVGVVLSQSLRRGRIYASPPEETIRVLADLNITPTLAPRSEPVTVENYGRMADALRRDLRVAKLVCLRG